MESNLEKVKEKNREQNQLFLKIIAAFFLIESIFIIINDPMGFIEGIIDCFK